MRANEEHQTDLALVNREVYYRTVYDEFYQVGKSISSFVVTLLLEGVQDAREFDEQVYEDHFAKA